MTCHASEANPDDAAFAGTAPAAESVPADRTPGAESAGANLNAYLHHAEGPDTPGGALAFGFHGTGGTEAQFLPLLRELLPGAAIVAPRGDVSEGGAGRFFRRRAEGVYDMDDLARATARMAGFVAAHIDRLRPARIVGIGYSNGANILASTVFARPGLFTDIVLMHPLIPWEPAPVPLAARVLITAGDRDPVCPPAATRALETWFADQGARLTTVRHPGGHEVARPEIDALAAFLAGETHAD